MEEPGRKLKRERERLQLKYRDVEEASQRLATRHKNPEYYIALSRLSDIENRGIVPSIFRLYSLCAIYRLDFIQVFGWYGVRLADIPGDAARITVPVTHLFQGEPQGDVVIPVTNQTLEVPTLDPKKTGLINRYLREWGKLPLQMLASLELRRYLYGFIGSDDWSMYPILPPGSLVQVDDSRRGVATFGWMHESERPIYFFEHRDGYACSWCSVSDGYLTLQPHASSHIPSVQFKYPGEVEVVGQVVGVAMRLDQAKRRRTRS
jgi:hypothetical protein